LRKSVAIFQVQKAKAVLLTPKREDVMESKESEITDPLNIQLDNEQLVEANREDDGTNLDIIQ